MPISAEAARYRGGIAGIKRAIKNGERPADDPVLAEYQRGLNDVLLAERVEKIIADWPKLSEAQQNRIAALLGGA